MGRPNAGGGRRNQEADAGPARARFSNFGQKGGKDDGKGKREKGPRQRFESQKEMDRAKGKGKGPTGAAAHIAAAEARAAKARGDKPTADGVSIWQRAAEKPSYVHGTFCMTRDDHLALEALLTPDDEADGGGAASAAIVADVSEEAQEHLAELGINAAKSRHAVDIVAASVGREAEEAEVMVTPAALAERALEWICSVSAEDELPAKLREAREITMARKAQEERNVAQQAKALLLGGAIDSIAIARIEKLGFSRARAIQALSEAPGNELLPAVRSLLAEHLPLDLPEGMDPSEIVPATLEEIEEEIECLRSIYGEEAVYSLGGQSEEEGMELSITMPASGVGGGAGRWQLLVMIPKGLTYPHVAPLLCPKHERLRDASRAKLMAALGKVCRESVGVPMLLIVCEWLQSNGNSFLVRTASAVEALKAAGKEAQASPTARDLAIERAVQKSHEDAQGADQADKAKRVAQLQAMMNSEGPRPKDKIASEIRAQPETAQYDLSGYDDQQAKQLVQEAFGSPMECSEMVRISLVVGGGKAVRGKYAESLPRTVASALQDIGYGQDSTASCDVQSAGKFKGQHDTQKNLKLVHVFPKIVGKVADDAGGVEPQHVACERVAQACWDEFVETVGEWTRSREGRSRAEALLTVLEQAVDELRRTDEALRAGRQVTASQRKRYDELGTPEDVAERIQWLTSQLASKGCPGRAKRAVQESAGEGVLSFDAPSRLQEAARLAGQEPAAAEKQQEDDASAAEAWLQRRIQQTRGESAKLKTEFRRERPLQKVRQGLPSYAMREEIQRGICREQVVLIEGETGCGKSTQIPQFIMEDWVDRDLGGAVNIIMTQPRRISAIGVSERIATEMDTPLGDLCGYSIRLESKRSQRTKILVCTTGVLLRRLESDRSLRGVTHIIVDECHERDLDTDFLLIVVRDLLPKRPQLKVVLMSATINADVFKDYFKGCLSFHIPGRTYPVTSYYLEHAILHTNFVIEPDSEYCRKDVEPWLSQSDEYELWSTYEKPEYKELMAGEELTSNALQSVHRVDPEKLNFDLIAAVVRHIHTTVDPATKRKHPGAILVFVPGLGEIKKTMRALLEGDARGRGSGPQSYGGQQGSSSGWPEATKDGLWVLPLHSMISVQEQRLVFKHPPEGCRKVVISTNIAETSITIDDVEYVVDCGRHKQTKYDPQNRVSMLVDCVETKANARQRRGRAGRVKPGVCYHLLNVRKWRRIDDFEKPEMLRVPLDSLCLRVSLMGMGHPAKVLAKAITPPTEAAVVSSLQQLVELSAVELREKVAADGGELAEIATEGWSKEDQQRLLKAKLQLTPLGNHLAQLPVDAACGKLLVLGCMFGVPRDVCTLAASLSARSPFQVTGVGGKGVGKGEADKKKLELSGDLESDQLLLVKLFDRWEELGKNTKEARSWCRQNNLDMHTFETVKDMKQHLFGVLLDQGFVAREKATDKAPPQRKSRWSTAPKPSLDVESMPACLSTIASASEEFMRRRFQLLRTLLVAALWPNVMLRRDDGGCFARNQQSLKFHPSSVLAVQSDQAAQDAAGDWNCPQCGFFNFSSREECKSCWGARPAPQKKSAKRLRHRAFMFGEKTRSLATQQGQKSATLCRECSGVPLKALYLLGHRVQVDYLTGYMSVDGWIHCRAGPRDASMLLGLRRRLQDVLMRKLTRQTGDPSEGSEDANVIDVVTQILVMDVE
eukprot:TRINITY_DN50669_c0_g1_i1.p1 TRINITY_DN50669_c0_g1~~TRINITY_DN50669_c0_g1_i1.p1  ORF type:complete len:1724 (+),score=429.05 TRINITY_DN50669_c0_g1_i1:83-5173(+)